MYTEKDFIYMGSNTQKNETGSFTWKSPSNIALIKYWGKSNPQIPKNPSISFTLNNCHTITTLEYSKKKNPSTESDIKVFFEASLKEEFKPKIELFFKRITKYVPFISDYNFTINTKNSFPHSSGIASSASGLSALAICLMSMEKKFNPQISEEYFLKKASFLARLGSGSAARSIEGPIVVWGNHPKIENSSDLYGTPIAFNIHPIFENYHDTILLVDKGEKKISSTIGHNLMHEHPYANQRFTQARNNMSKMIEILKSGNLNSFIDLVESEALTLHAMMLTSNPYFILMKPNTLKIIEKIWDFRKNNNSNICFTLDAGANIHVLFPDGEKEKSLNFITNELLEFCENKQFISDSLGMGAEINA